MVLKIKIGVKIYTEKSNCRNVVTGKDTKYGDTFMGIRFIFVVRVDKNFNI